MYVDGFVLPIPKDNIEKYREIASRAGAVWREYGALEYLPKPVPFERLRASAVRAIELRRARAEAKRALSKMRSGEHRRDPLPHQGERELSRGELLAGRYRIGRLLGAGGMGIVFAARHYLIRLPSPPPCRFDVVGIEGTRVQWLRAAFDAA